MSGPLARRKHSAGGPRRVAYLAYESELGGGEVLLLRQLAHQRREAFAPIVIAPREGELTRRARQIGVPAFTLPIDAELITRSGLRLPRPRVLARLWALLRRERIELIHGFTLSTRSYANAAGLLTGLPVFHSCQDTWLSDRLTARDWWIMNRIPQRVVATSRSVMKN